MHEVKDNGRPFAVALRDAIAARGVTLAWLRTRLVDSGNPVSVATLSYWRSGERTPEGAASLAAVEELERLLGLDRDYLVSRIGPSTRLGPVAEQKAPVEPDLEKAFREVEAALGAPPLSITRDVSCHVNAYVNADGRVERRVGRYLMQAMVDGITVLPFYGNEVDPISELAEFTVRLGGRLKASYLHPDGYVFGHLVALDEPLSLGETTLIEIEEARMPRDFEDRSVAHGTSNVLKEILLQVQFHPDAVPLWCAEHVQPAGEEDYSTVPRRVVAGSVHAVRHAFGPATLAISWGYDR